MQTNNKYKHTDTHTHTHPCTAMSYPYDDPFHQNNLSTVRTFLDEKHPSGYLVFNLSENSYDASKLDNHVRHVLCSLCSGILSP